MDKLRGPWLPYAAVGLSVTCCALLIAGVGDAATNHVLSNVQPMDGPPVLVDLGGPTWVQASRVLAGLPLWLLASVALTGWMWRRSDEWRSLLRISFLLLAVCGLAVAVVGAMGGTHPVTVGAEIVLGALPNTIRVDEALEVGVGLGVAATAVVHGRRARAGAA